MGSILGTKWEVSQATEDVPFEPGKFLEITVDAEVIYDGEPLAKGEYLEPQNKVVALSASIEGDIYWELVGSEVVFGTKQALYGLRWKSTLPDAMGAWVCDPQSGS